MNGRLRVEKIHGCWVRSEEMVCCCMGHMGDAKWSCGCNDEKHIISIDDGEESQTAI